MSKLLALACSVLTLSVSAIGCNPCEDGCSGGPPPDPAVECIEPASEDAITFLNSDNSFQLEYGPQGGQHFYLSLALQGLVADEIVMVEFETEDGTFDTIPYIEAGCPKGQAVELRQLAFSLPSDDDYEGKLTVSIGKCDTSDDGYCTHNEAGQVTDFEARVDISQNIVVLAP